MIALFRKIQLEDAKQLGCGDCTMLESWATSTIQLPEKCRLDDRFAYCPVTGRRPRDWQEIWEKSHFLFVEEE